MVFLAGSTHVLWSAKHGVLSVLIFATLATCKLPPIKVKAGVVLTQNSSLMYDMRNVRPAIEVGYAAALELYNVEFDTIWIAYDTDCKQWNALGQSVILSVIDQVDVIIGPGCSDDLIIVCELTTFFQVPILSGAGELIDTTFVYPYLIRFSFNTYSLWRIFVQMMKFYQWTNIVMIRDCCDYPKNVSTRGFINILADNNLTPFEVKFKTGSVNSTAVMEQHLTSASKNGRIIVMVMESLLLRKFMLTANRIGMCEGEYAFLALDLYQDDIVGSGKSGWKQSDAYDLDARHAYKSLFVLTLMDKKSLPAYQKFERDVTTRAQKYYPGQKVDINYHTGAFHDSVIMFAATANMTVGDGFNVSKQYILPLTQRFWGITFEGGASGRVYIDPWGDRSDDHQLLHLVDNSDDFQVIANYYGYRGLYEEVTNISWPGKNRSPPLNRPRCGYQGENPACQPQRQPLIEITVGVALGALVLAVVFGILIFRRARQQAALSSMDWIAIWAEVSFTNNPAASSRMSKITTETELYLDNGPNDSNFSEVSTLHTSTAAATFRGNAVIVRGCEKHKIELNKMLMTEIKEVRITTHENLLRFVGAILGPDRTAVIYEMCTKGILQNMLSNDAIKLDDLFKNSLINDLMKGMLYIHNSVFQVHGRLTSRCLWIDSRFVLKVGDYGLPLFFETQMPLKPDNAYFQTLLWKAPEEIQKLSAGTQEGDVYSFGIILQEICLREEPFAMFQLAAEEIVHRILKETDPPFRPKVDDSSVASKELTLLMRRCWSQYPTDRPKFPDIRSVMREISKNDAPQGNIMDALLSRMEQYAQNLESIVEEKTQAFLEEKRKSDQLLSQVLPKAVAEQLKKGEQVHPESYESVTIYFSDIVGFTTLSSSSTPMEIVDFLNDLYTCFDNIIMRYDVYKVETIGDSYMCVSGLPLRNGMSHAVHIARMALALLQAVKTFKIRHRPDEKLKLRIGLHSGPCVAGVVGLTMPRFCLFGDTVNTASRMESTGEALKIQISSFTKSILDTFRTFVCEERGEIPVKGKGQVTTFWLIGES